MNKTGKMSKSGFTLVEVMIVVALVVLLAAIAIPNVMRARINSNNTAARATLRTLSTAAETYAAVNSGIYPASEASLTNTTPPYLNQFYCGFALTGFTFTCTWATSGYTLVATPVSFQASGSATYTITTGGILTP